MGDPIVGSMSESARGQERNSVEDLRVQLSDSYWVVPLRATAVVMTIFGVTCLAVLAVVTAIDEKSALATVTLALAILAFTVQLIVFIAQQAFAGEQSRRNEELYGEMQKVLAEIHEKAAGTHDEVRTIRETMLPALLWKQSADPAGGQIDPGSLSRILGAEPVVQVRQIRGQQANWPARVPSENDAHWCNMLETYPDEDEVGNTMEVVESLSREERKNLKAFGEDEIMMRQPDSPFDPALTELAGSGLIEKKLVEPYPDKRVKRFDGLQVLHLTDQGRKVARLLTAKGDSPEYLRGLAEIRADTPDRLPAYQAQRRRL